MKQSTYYAQLALHLEFIQENRKTILAPFEDVTDGPTDDVPTRAEVRDRVERELPENIPEGAKELTLAITNFYLDLEPSLMEIFHCMANAKMGKDYFNQGVEERTRWMAYVNALEAIYRRLVRVWFRGANPREIISGWRVHPTTGERVKIKCENYYNIILPRRAHFVAIMQSIGNLPVETTIGLLESKVDFGDRPLGL